MARKRGGRKGGRHSGIGSVRYKSNAGFHGGVGLGAAKLGGARMPSARKGKRK